MTVYFDDVNVGDAIPALTTEPITETQLVRYSGASGDFNPIHTVHHVAEQAGLGGVIAHGMFVMGLVGRAITDWVGVAPLRKFGVRFLGMTKPGQAITVIGQVVEKLEVEGEHQVRCEISAVDQEGHQKVQGSFVVVLPTRK
ncbi:MAG TPA: MaoC/PaaZ C-terminal domain-containing protein [Anaerolineae bacterium]|jgi:acyl dehydratase